MKAELARIRADIAQICDLAGVTPPRLNPADITVILSAPGCGADLVGAWLHDSGAFQSAASDETTLFRLADQGWATSKNHSEAIRIPVDDTHRERALDLLALDVGGAPTTDLNAADYLARSASRLRWQWAHVDLEPREVLHAFRTAATRAPDAESLWREVLSIFNLDAGFYDLPGPRSRNLGFEMPEFLLEAPPFRITFPRAPADPDRSLLLTSTANVYRIPWLKTLFPQARWHWLQLARDPRDAVGQLVEGWTSAFRQTHNLQFVTPLKIRDYTDVLPLADRWWKFDLPPGWADFDDAPLAMVCGYQWRAAFAAAVPVEHRLCVMFEKLNDEPEAYLESILSFCGGKKLRIPPWTPRLRTAPLNVSDQLDVVRLARLLGYTIE